MGYLEEIDSIISRIPKDTMDFSMKRHRNSPPTMASSEFITNKQQGDWAENLLFKAINENAKNHVAVRYGKSDDIVAGDEGFKEFYENYQMELDTIGKRPDLLIFKSCDFNPDYGLDISHMPSEQIDGYVKQAIGGIEIRSSAFLHKKYDDCKRKTVNDATNKAMHLRSLILDGYEDLLTTGNRLSYLKILKEMTVDGLDAIQFKRPSWHSSERMNELSKLFSELKGQLEIVQNQTELSITPKMEDLTVVHKWIQTYGVPHFYFQVFFDTIYGISFKEILEIITSPCREDVDFCIDAVPKNQFKTTVRIFTKSAKVIAGRVDEPKHKSVRKELPKGRLLYYVTFHDGKAYLDVDCIKNMLGIAENEVF